MNMEQTFTVLRREQLLIDHAPHSVQFQDLTDSLLRVCSAAAVIPALSALEIRLYSTLALLHDVGKRAIPREILNKPGSLTKEEFEVMKTHTTIGCEILDSFKPQYPDEFYQYCYEICRHHHERADGRGYPDHLAGDEIPISAQIVSIADVYEALVSERVYKSAYSNDEAYQMILNGECGQFSEDVIECFKLAREDFFNLVEVINMFNFT